MSYSNSPMGNNPLARTGLSVQELKQLTAIRMSQTHPPNDSRNRSLPKEIPGHPPRNPIIPQAPARQSVYPAPHLESKSKVRVETQHTKSSKSKGRGRTSPVDTNFGAMPHGLTVQELKELTRMRLAREAVTPYSPEASEYSDARTHTTNATFRSGYTVGDIDSYSDSGSVPRNRSTSTSPISNTDSDSFEDGYARYPPSYHHPLPISPASLSRSERERPIPYSPDNIIPSYIPSPHPSPIHATSQSMNHFSPSNVSQKTFSGIHPGLQQHLAPSVHNADSATIRNIIDDSRSMVDHGSASELREDYSSLQDSNMPVATSAHRAVVPNALSFGDRESIPSSSVGVNSLRKFALTNTMNNLEGGYDVLSSGCPPPPLNPLFSFNTPPIGEPSPPGSPQRSFRGKKKLVIDCPAPVRIRSSSDCNELAFEMAEAVLNSPGPNSPMNSSKPTWSDPPSRRTSVCSIHSDTGFSSGILHDSTGIGLSVPILHHPEEIQLRSDDTWTADLDQVAQQMIHLAHSPVTLHSPSDSFNTNGNHGNNVKS